MRIVALSDLHGYLPRIPECDLVIIAGDICPTSNHEPQFQANWLKNDFRAWLSGLPAKEIVGVAGNHDFVFEQLPMVVPHDLAWHYLEDQTVVIDGLVIHGAPWQPWFYDWAFNAPRFDQEEKFLTERFAQVPNNCDLLIVHGPPLNVCDQNNSGLACGSRALYERIKAVQPAVMVCGHIHEAYGPGMIGKTLVMNASYVDVNYNPRSGVSVIDLTEVAGRWQAELITYAP